MKPAPAAFQTISALAQLIARNVGDEDIRRDGVEALVRACDSAISLLAFAVGDLGVMEPELKFVEPVVDVLGYFAQELRERMPGLPERREFHDWPDQEDEP